MCASIHSAHNNFFHIHQKLWWTAVYSTKRTHQPHLHHDLVWCQCWLQQQWLGHEGEHVPVKGGPTCLQVQSCSQVQLDVHWRMLCICIPNGPYLSHTIPPPCRWPPPLVSAPPGRTKKHGPPSRCPPPSELRIMPPPPPWGFLPKGSQCRAFLGSTLLEDAHAKLFCSYD